MKKYKQINYEDKITIRYELLKKNSILGCSQNAISKEIKCGISFDASSQKSLIRFF